MQEGHTRAADAAARVLVDQLEARAAQALERGLDVLDLVGDVVQARALAREEAPDGRLGESGASNSTWFSPTSKQQRLDALLGDDLAMGDRELEGVAVELERGSIASTATPMWSMRLNISPRSLVIEAPGTPMRSIGAPRCDSRVVLRSPVIHQPRGGPTVFRTNVRSVTLFSRR